MSGIAAGLHATVRLPESDDETAIVEQARRRRIEVGPMAENSADPAGRPPMLLLGYGTDPGGRHPPARSPRWS